MTEIKQLKCPSCGGVVTAGPGTTRTTCIYCGADLAINLDRQEAMLYAIQQRETSRERDRLAEERKQMYAQYMLLYSQIGQIDADLRQREILQQTQVIRSQIAELYRRRTEVVQGLALLGGQIAKMDQVLQPGLPTHLPVPAIRRPPRHINWSLLGAALLVLVAAAVAVTVLPGLRLKFDNQPPSAPQPEVSAALTPTPDRTVIALAASPPPGTGSFYAKATSHSVTAFARPFTDLGGVTSLGYPITEAFVESDPQDGQKRWVQYFEKAVLEYHPELPDPYKYQLARLGAWQFARRHTGPTPEPRKMPGNDSQRFAQTGFTVTDPFLSHWHRGGELVRFGYPISPPFGEQSDIDRKTYTVQYFERAVMEYHPEMSPPYNVQLTPIGTLRLKAYYPAGVPMDAGKPVAQPTAP